MLQFLLFIPANNTCSESGCSHICLLSAVRTEGFTCMCPDGISLGENERECNCKLIYNIIMWNLAPIFRQTSSHKARGRAQYILSNKRLRELTAGWGQILQKSQLLQWFHFFHVCSYCDTNPCTGKW